MIDYLRSIAVFTRVAEEGSFSEAARSLCIAPSRVSELISKLEHHVGVTLFNRTTRKVVLTSEGRLFLKHTSGILENAERGLNELKETKLVPTGSLRISVPTYLLSSSLTRAMSRFLMLHPQVNITADFLDHTVNPIEDNYDVCISSGKSNSATTRKLDTFERAIFVGKGYLEDRPKADHPKELMTWDWVNYRHPTRCYKLQSIDGEIIKLSISDQARLQVNSFDALYSFTCMDLGVAVMPLEFAQRGIIEERLVRIFDDWHLPKVDYFAVWPDKSHRKSLVTVFVDFLSDYLHEEAQ